MLRQDDDTSEVNVGFKFILLRLELQFTGILLMGVL